MQVELAVSELASETSTKAANSSGGNERNGGAGVLCQFKQKST
jgi:hypothetical protein